MSKALQVGMAFEAAFVCGRLHRCVSSPGYPLLLSIVRAGNLKPVVPDLNGQGVAWCVCQRTLEFAFFMSLE